MASCIPRAVAQGRGPDASELYARGSAAFAAGRLDEARNVFTQLVRQYPKVAAAHVALGTVLLAQGRSREAVSELSTAHRIDPRDGHALLTLGIAQKDSAQYADAVNSFRSAVEAGTTLSERETLAFAVALSGNGAPAEAEVLLKAAVERGETSAALLDALGTVTAQQRRYEQAEAQLEAALTADVRYVPAHAHLGSVLLALHQPAPAASEFKKAVDLGDASSATAAQFGRALVELNRADDAVAVLEPALQRDPSSLHLMYALALARQAQGDAAASLALFAKFVAAEPENAEALTNYGLALVQTGDAAGGLRRYQAALAHSDNALLRQNIGVAYLQQSDLDHALEQFRAGLAKEPGSVQLHYDLGLALKLKDDVAGATAELRKTEELDPNLPDAPYTLGVLEMQQGRFQEAAQQLQKAVMLEPHNGEAWALLGSVYRQGGESEKAAEALRQAIKLQPDAPGPHITLASVMQESGDRASATAERKIAANLSRVAVNAQRATFSLRSGRALLAQGKATDALVQMQAAVTAAPNSAEAHRGLADALQQTGQSAEAKAEREKAAALDPAKR
ncbi:tetratricopeptide repeat protein [Terriglobus roseus]|nr:tetratricopeptide repeat protein [Terriglobus roseus]